MQDSRDSKTKNFTAFRSAAEEADTKRENDAIKREEQAWDNEGGHMSSTAGRITRVSGADLPYVVTLAHHRSEPSAHAFATMREAEAFIERNTPVPRRALSPLYDRPASDFGTPASARNDEDFIARLSVIDQRLRQVSTEEAASVLASGLAKAGIHEREQLRLVTEIERNLDEIDRKSGD